MRDLMYVGKEKERERDKEREREKDREREGERVSQARMVEGCVRRLQRVCHQTMR